MRTTPLITGGTLALACSALRRRREIIKECIKDARDLARRTGATSDELHAIEQMREDLAAVDAAITEICEALAGTSTPDVTAGVAELTLGAGNVTDPSPVTPPDQPLLRLGPGGDFTRDIRPEDLR